MLRGRVADGYKANAGRSARDECVVDATDTTFDICSADVLLVVVVT